MPTPGQGSKEKAKKFKVKDEELIENYYRYSLQIGKTLTQGTQPKAPENQYRGGPPTVEESVHTGTDAYHVTYPDDGTPLLDKDHRRGKAIVKNPSRIQSHPNFANQSTDAMAVAQSNIAHRQTALVVKDSLAGPAPLNALKVAAPTTTVMGGKLEGHKRSASQVEMLP